MPHLWENDNALIASFLISFNLTWQILCYILVMLITILGLNPRRLKTFWQCLYYIFTDLNTYVQAVSRRSTWRTTRVRGTTTWRRRGAWRRARSAPRPRLPGGRPPCCCRPGPAPCPRSNNAPTNSKSRYISFVVQSSCERPMVTTRMILQPHRTPVFFLYKMCVCGAVYNRA